MKKKVFSIALGVSAIAGIAYYSHAPIQTGKPIQKQTQTHIGPEYLYPNPDFTAGKVETLSILALTSKWDCKTKKLKQNGDCTYSKAHRQVSLKEKKEVCEKYKTCEKLGNAKEIDHFAPPLCAGGSNSAENLWPMPEHNMWNGKDFGFRTKDKLEAWGCRQIKAGKLSPQEFYEKMKTDWVVYYLEMETELNNLGNISNEEVVE